MRTFTVKRDNWSFLVSFIVLMTFFLMCPPYSSTANKKEGEKKETPEFKVFGRDPNAYGDAAAMLFIPSQRLLDDETAKTIVDALAMAIAKGEQWPSQIWALLNSLRYVRLSPFLVQSLQNTAKKMAVTEKKPSQKQVASAKQAFEQGNRHYEAGKFDHAVESYHAALKDHPAYWDAYNNMALSEMHRNNDLVALFLFSTLTKNNPKYAGGSINLTVCLERLGQSVASYNIAAALASKQDRMPMAQYNMAWFENSRGKYESSSGYLLKALTSVPDYSVANWLQSISDMESGRSITADELKALPRCDHSQGVPNIVSRPVKVAMADAYSGKNVVTRIPKDSRLVVSKESGDWYGFYWPVEDIKRFLWVHKTNLGNSRIEIAAEGIKPFMGTWTGKWGNYTEQEIRIQEVAGKPKVTMCEDKVRDEKLENGSLSFWAKKQAFASEWYRYTLNVTSVGLEMDVFRIRDNQKFSGKLTKK